MAEPDLIVAVKRENGQSLGRAGTTPLAGPGDRNRIDAADVITMSTMMRARSKHSAWKPVLEEAAAAASDLTHSGTLNSRLVRHYVSRFRGNAAVPTPPKPRAVTAWIMTRPDRRADSDRASLDAILASSAELAALTASVRAFAVIMNERRGRKLLEPWMTAALELRRRRRPRDLKDAQAADVRPRQSGPAPPPRPARRLTSRKLCQSPHRAAVDRVAGGVDYRLNLALRSRRQRYLRAHPVVAPVPENFSVFTELELGIFTVGPAWRGFGQLWPSGARSWMAPYSSQDTPVMTMPTAMRSAECERYGRDQRRIAVIVASGICRRGRLVSGGVVRPRPMIKAKAGVAAVCGAVSAVRRDCCSCA
jgi:hypothetical protein